MKVEQRIVIQGIPHIIVKVLLDQVGRKKITRPVRLIRIA